MAGEDQKPKLVDLSKQQSAQAIKPDPAIDSQDAEAEPKKKKKLKKKLVEHTAHRYNDKSPPKAARLSG